MAKPIKFNLILDGQQVRDIKGLQENFCLADILDAFRSGVLQKWLQVRGHADYLKEIEKIKKDESILINLVKIFQVDKSENEIKEAMYNHQFWEKRKAELEGWMKKNIAIKDIITAYHANYNEIKADISQLKDDMPFVKEAIKEIYDNHSGLFDLNHEHFFEQFKEDAPLAILAILMQPELRKYFLDNERIKNELTLNYTFDSCVELEGLYNRLYNIGEAMKEKAQEKEIGGLVGSVIGHSFLVAGATHKLTNHWLVRMGAYTSYPADQTITSEDSDAINLLELVQEYNAKIGLHLFAGETAEYWKDLEIKTKKIMVLSIPKGTFVRNSDQQGGDLTSEDVNGKFPILDGLDYKSNTDDNFLVYMEV
ncbi:MAG: hypothetical protein JZU65_11450 [Chlorobium sp.]|nr:hypothetical protein [Chlorobium sp.]